MHPGSVWTILFVNWNGQLKRNIREFLQIGPIGTSSFMESESDYRTGMFFKCFNFDNLHKRCG